jgi:hypothetical protein
MKNGQVQGPVIEYAKVLRLELKLAPLWEA